MKSCFFIGHRDADERLLPYLTETTERLITKRGVTRFYVGGYGNFDRLSGKAVITLKNRFHDIRLFLVIPYHPAERPVPTPRGYDGTYYPQGLQHCFLSASVLLRPTTKYSDSRTLAAFSVSSRFVRFCPVLLIWVKFRVTRKERRD